VSPWITFNHGAGVPQALHDKPMLDRWAALNELTAAE